jgi:energy-converting hydrogenase Eha subunit A
MLHVAALLVVLLAIAHSVLGERYILMRLFRRDLPKLFGRTAFTRQTLRFAWHLTTVLALGIGALLLQLAGSPSPAAIARTLGACLVASGLLPLLYTRGRHPAWVVLFVAGALCLVWTPPD